MEKETLVSRKCGSQELGLQLHTGQAEGEEVIRWAQAACQGLQSQRKI